MVTGCHCSAPSVAPPAVKEKVAIPAPGGTAPSGVQNRVESASSSAVTSARNRSNGANVARGAAPAQVTVRLPANAKLFVDNVYCPLTSATRSFPTPDLQFGQKYYYDLRMQIQRDGQLQQQLRRVVLSAGQHVEVNFNQPNSVNTVQR